MNSRKILPFFGSLEVFSLPRHLKLIVTLSISHFSLIFENFDYKKIEWRRKISRKILKEKIWKFFTHKNHKKRRESWRGKIKTVRVLEMILVLSRLKPERQQGASEVIFRENREIIFRKDENENWSVREMNFFFASLLPAKIQRAQFFSSFIFFIFTQRKCNENFSSSSLWAHHIKRKKTHSCLF